MGSNQLLLWGKEAFDGEIENDAAVGNPALNVNKRVALTRTLKFGEVSATTT